MKRMMTINEQDGKTIVDINFSSADIIMRCPRKAQYYLLNNYRADTEAQALTFGRAIHKALELWYSTPKNERQYSPEDIKAIPLDLDYSLPINAPPKQNTAICAYTHFLQAAEVLPTEEDSSHRTKLNGIRLLDMYFKHYTNKANDDLEIYYDDKGPFIERDFEFKLYEDDELIINYFGTIDCVMHTTNGLAVVDHKTTSRMGNEFLHRIKPNMQYCGYVYALTQAFNLPCNLFVANGILVSNPNRRESTSSKTQDFIRQQHEFTSFDFKEFTDTIVTLVKTFLSCIDMDKFPMYAPNSCTMFGVCIYHDICTIGSPTIRNNIIKFKYGSDNDTETDTINQNAN